MMTTKAPRLSSLTGSIAILLGYLLQASCSGDGSGSDGDEAWMPPVGLGPVASSTGLEPSGPGEQSNVGPGVGAVGTDPGPGMTGVGGPGAIPGVSPAGTGGPIPVGSTDVVGVNPVAPSPADVTPPADEPSAGFIRRLTHIEFDNTIADLLNVDSQPSAGFASDIAMQGFTNNSAGQNVTPTLAEQYISVAEELSRSATTNLTQFLRCDPASLGEEACVEQFVADFGKRAWRRPLNAEEQARALELFRGARAEYELDTSVQMVVQFFLLSPHFVYLVEPLPDGAAPGSVVPLDSWKVASRLSYFLLGTMPDEALFAAAEAGALETPEGVAEQARRLLSSPRARQRIGLFFTEWLRLRHIDKLQKDTTMFPDYEMSLGPLMREQVERFAQAVILDDEGTVADLLTAPFTFVNNRLAPLFGVEAPAGSTMTRVELDPTERAGLLTHPALLATLAHQNQTDPVVRGKFVRESLLCFQVPPVPVGLVVSAPEIVPGSTTRERFSQHQEDPACSGCHLLMDPIGLGFEHYDPIGQWRDLDNGLPVDATGDIIGTDVAGTFDGAIELSQKLAKSEEVANCFAKTWLRFALGRSEQDADQGALAVAGERFKASGFTISELLVALTETKAFRYQRVLDPNTTALEDSSTSAMDAMEETP